MTRGEHWARAGAPHGNFEGREHEQTLPDRTTVGGVSSEAQRRLLRGLPGRAPVDRQQSGDEGSARHELLHGARRDLSRLQDQEAGDRVSRGECRGLERMTFLRIVRTC